MTITSLDSRLAALAALAGAAAVTTPAQATIVYVNLSASPIVVPATTAGIYLNLVTGVSNIAPASAPGWDVNPFSTTTLSFFNPTAPAGGVYVVNAAGGSSATLPDNLALGTLISAASGFGSGTAETTGATAFTLNSTNNYLGIRLQNETTANATNYGWVQFSIGAAFTTRSIIGYAYGNAGESILAGQQVSVPEPSTVAALGAMALGAVGVRSWRRRRAA